MHHFIYLEIDDKCENQQSVTQKDLKKTYKHYQASSVSCALDPLMSDHHANVDNIT